MTKKVFVAGHNGMVGSAISRTLLGVDPRSSMVELITRDRDHLDLTDQGRVRDFFFNEKPDEVYLAAARVGGIHANNSYPAEFIYQNLIIQANVVNAAFEAGVRRLLFLGSSCIYPRDCAQPMEEEFLLASPLEPTNEPYAIAKIAGIKLCESYNRQYGESHGVDYRSIMPTNLYGPGDNYHSTDSHVLPALIRKFYEAVRDHKNRVSVWGSGNPYREFLHVDDMASAAIHLMDLPVEVYRQNTRPMCSHINAGSGEEIRIADLAQMIGDVAGFTGNIIFDSSMPDGTPRKLLSSSTLESTGWRPKVTLREGVKAAYREFAQQEIEGKLRGDY